MTKTAQPKPEEATPENSQQTVADTKDELPEDALDKISGGARRTGPGTQTEDDIYVG